MVSLLSVQGIETARGYEEFPMNNELFAVGQLGSEKSYLYRIELPSGKLILIGDTGMNNCTGLDFTPDGKLKAFCELREGEEVTSKGPDPLPGVAVELDPGSASATWAVPHGVSSAISDIAINDLGELFSYENVKLERLHKHLAENDFQANWVGETGLEALDHAMAFWGDGELKLAANTIAPSLFKLDTSTAAPAFVGEISFPDTFVITMSGQSSTREIDTQDIQFASMDSVSFAKGSGNVILNTKAALHSFPETDADFMTLMFQATGQADAAGESARIDGPERWAAVGLMDTDSLQIDFIVEIQGEADVRAIAVRKIEPRPIPTLSEWGLILTTSSLFVLALFILVKRKRASQV